MLSTNRRITLLPLLAVICFSAESGRCQAGTTGPGDLSPVSIRLDNHLADQNPLNRSRNLTATVSFSDETAAEPMLTVEAWDGEGRLVVDLASDRLSEQTMTRALSVRNSRDRVTLASTEREHDLYVREDDGFEWNIVLNTPLPDTLLTYDIETRGLVFAFQPPLDGDTVDYDVDSTGHTVVAGVLHRPDSVVGSYAVYHRNGRDNRHRIVDGETSIEAYGTGKAFHIYRPKAFDVSIPSRTTWCNLYIDTIEARLTIAIPSEFLREAVFPVTIDPTIGTETVGASVWEITSDNYRGNRYQIPETVEYLDSIIWWVYDDITAGDSTSAGVYAADGSLIDCAAERGVTEFKQTVRFESGVIFGADIASGDYVWLTIFASGAHYLRYDTYSIPYGGKYYYGWQAGGCSDPCGGFAWDTGNDRRISIYVVYNEVGATTGGRRRRTIMTEEY